MGQMLDYLGSYTGGILSDLRREMRNGIIFPLLMNMEEGRFSASDWSETLSYVFAEKLTFYSVKQAKDYLSKKMKENGFAG